MKKTVFEMHNAEELIKKFFQETKESEGKQIASIQEVVANDFTKSSNCDRFLITDKTAEYLFCNEYFERGLEHGPTKRINVTLTFAKCKSLLNKGVWEKCKNCNKEFLFVEIRINTNSLFYRVLLK